MTAGPPGRVSVVATVLNERESVGALLEGLAGQTRRPDEVILVDGGSTDGTPDIVERFPSDRLRVRLIRRPGANISQGRNAAIAAATGEIIACVDAGVRLEPTWLTEIVAPFESPSGVMVDVVSGFFRPDPRTPFETAMGATVLPNLAEIDPATFLPSSRSVAFRKSAWELVGGYPEWLDYCEDLVFDFALRDRGCRFVFRPSALVHFRPRGSLGAFFRQYYRYARGDGKAGLWARRHAIRYVTYVAAPLAVLLGVWYKLAWLPVLFGVALYVRQPYRRLVPWARDHRPRDVVLMIALVPLIRFVGDVAKMAGYPVGLWWRFRRRFGA